MPTLEEIIASENQSNEEGLNEYKEQKKSHKRKPRFTEEKKEEKKEEIVIEIDEESALTLLQTITNVALSASGMRQITDINEIAGAKPFAKQLVDKYAAWLGKYQAEIMVALILLPVISVRAREKKEKEKEKTVDTTAINKNEENNG